MGNVVDRIVLAFARLFADVAGGNFSDIAISDLGIVAVVLAIPLFTIFTLVGSPRN